MVDMQNSDGIVTEASLPTYKSFIAKLATSRPVDFINDIESINVNESLTKIDILSSDSQFVKVIMNNPYIKYLDISDCNNITIFPAIAKLKNIEQLDLTNCNIEDFSFLKKCKKLKILNLTNTKITDLSVLSGLDKLEILSLRNTKIKTLNGIEGCYNLKELVLTCCTSLMDINALMGCVELIAIDLTACPLIKSLSSLNSTKMKYLFLNYTTIDDLSAIAKMKGLELFTQDYCKVILTDQILEYFANLTALKSLNMRNRGVRNINFLKKLINLKDLDISGNMLNDLSPLANLIQLKNLNISTNVAVTDIYSLSNLVNIENLNISGSAVMPMSVENISVVTQMPNLKSIKMNYNKKIKTISPLKYCSKLEECEFSYCLGIISIYPLRFCPNIKSISFEGCPMVKDYSFLRTTNIANLNLQKTTIDQIYISGFTNTSPSFKMDAKPDSILVVFYEYMKSTKRIIDILKKVTS